MKMKIKYGRGVYTRLEGGKKTTYTGELVLDEVKIYIEGKVDSSISLDRIEEIKKTKKGIEMEIIPSSYSFAYKVLVQGKEVRRLLDDLLTFKEFEKVWWRNKWRARHFQES